MNRKATAALAADRKIALSAGKQHRAGFNELHQIHQLVGRGDVSDLRKEFERLRKKAKIDKRGCEPLERIIDLITPSADSRLSDIAAEVRRIYNAIRRSKTVNPILLALAGVADDSVAYAAKESAKPRRRSATQPASESQGGVVYQYTVPIQLGGVSADMLGWIRGYNYAQDKGWTHGESLNMALRWAANYSYMFILSQAE
jgi:hypothetical protein